jgi:hypothetical protein
MAGSNYSYSVRLDTALSDSYSLYKAYEKTKYKSIALHDFPFRLSESSGTTTQQSDALTIRFETDDPGFPIDSFSLRCIVSILFSEGCVVNKEKQIEMFDESSLEFGFGLCFLASYEERENGNGGGNTVLNDGEKNGVATGVDSNAEGVHDSSRSYLYTFICPNNKRSTAWGIGEHSLYLDERVGPCKGYVYMRVERLVGEDWVPVVEGESGGFFVKSS